MKTELDVLEEHWERYRAVTLQFLDVLTGHDLDWRPDPESFSCAQHLLHIAQTEDYYCRGLFLGEWESERLRFPASAPDADGLRAYFLDVRRETRRQLERLADADLGVPYSVPHAPADFPLRWWLWFVLEHEMHHKAQLAVYARRIGRVAPYYALPMPLGERPDIHARQELGGVVNMRGQ